MNDVFIDTNNITNIQLLVVISDDVDFINRIRIYNTSKYKILFFSQKDSFIEYSVRNETDIIIFDNTLDNLEDFIKNFRLIQSYDLNIPMFVLEEEILMDVSLHKYSNAYSIFLKERSIAELFLLIDLSLYYVSMNKRFLLDDGFYFDKIRELLFHKKIIVRLTQLEMKLIKLLVENPNKLVTYDEISKVVWIKKNFSIYTLRNVVKNIREKTNNSFILNSSNRGYIIKSYY
jgi:DNA-binding response OmpR family regulator